MARKGINSTHSIYYGRRRSLKRRLTIFLLVLLLIAMALAAGFFYLQEYIVYTADGFRFDFPFLQPNNTMEQPDPEAPPEQIPLITDDDSQKKEDDQQPEDNPEQTQPVQNLAAHWAAGELSRVNDPAYREVLIDWARQTECDSIVFTVKTPNGQVLIPTDSAIAAQIGSVQADPAIAEGLAALKAEGFHLVARLSANRDNIAPRALRENMVATYSGVTWMDYDYLTWMAPSGPNTAEYLGQLAASCKQLGFNTLLLTDLGYPTRGKTSIVGTDRQGDRSALTAQMIQNLRAAAGDMKIAAELTETAATQMTDAEAGQDVAQLATVCDWLAMTLPFAEDPAADPLRQTLEVTDCQLLLSLPADMLPADKGLNYYLR